MWSPSGGYICGKVIFSGGYGMKLVCLMVSDWVSCQHKWDFFIRFSVFVLFNTKAIQCQ